MLDSLNMPAYGGPMAVVNGSGYDEFTMTSSSLPWGSSINNDSGGLGANRQFDLDHLKSSIGTGP